MATGVWALLLDRTLSQGEEAWLRTLLPPQRRERLDRMRLREKRQEVLCAYLILRRALEEQYQCTEIPPMAYHSDQKPFFPDFPGIHFNISHTEGAVLAALSGAPVGIDLERVRPLSPLTRRRIAQDLSEEAFFAGWVRREAIGKWKGTGVYPHDPEPVCPPECGYYALDTFPGYAAGICLCTGQLPLEIHRRRLSEIL